MNEIYEHTWRAKGNPYNMYDILSQSLTFAKSAFLPYPRRSDLIKSLKHSPPWDDIEEI